MKQKLVKMLAFLLCFCMLLGAVPLNVFAEETVSVEAEPQTAPATETDAGEVPADDEPKITDYDSFLASLQVLEILAQAYVAELAPDKDPVGLVIKYIRTGVDRYNTSSWGIMAGYEDAEFAALVEESDAEFMEMFGASMVSLKNIEKLTLPNGQLVDLGHMFGSMDITYHNKGSMNHMDVSGWAGDLCDLLSMTDGKVTGELEAMITEIRADYLGLDVDGADSFGYEDIWGDLDAFYVMEQLYATTIGEDALENGVITPILRDYFTADLTDADRADYFLKNRFDGVSKREDVRNAVYKAYAANKVVSTLEGTREFTATNLSELRKACCYAFADYLCQLAGDYVEITENKYYSVFSKETSTLAPGVTQEINYARSADNLQQVFYIATADITRDDVAIYANYSNNDPSTWATARVTDQLATAQAKYGDPASEAYIPNYNAIVGVNADFYNMQTGEPTGVLVMNGVQYHGAGGTTFFAIMKDGTAMIGNASEWNRVKNNVAEAVGGSAWLLKDGKVATNPNTDYYTQRHSRTCVGVTKTGKVVLMVLDGRQQPFSAGGSLEELAQIMLEAGCVNAINLDGGGSTTFAAKQEGADEITLINRPSDGFERSVSSSLMIVSTANTSTEFDHAVLTADTDYLTRGSSVQLYATGVSASGNAAEIPEGAVWKMDESIPYNLEKGTVTEDGVFTAANLGEAVINLMQGETVLGTIRLETVVPSNLGTMRKAIDVVYGERLALPVVAYYQGKSVTINASDVTFTLSNNDAGTIENFVFVGNEAGGVKSVTVTCKLASDPSVSTSLKLTLYKQGEASFDFDQATAGDRAFAWDRKVSNSTTTDEMVYSIANPSEDMVTSYIFAIDMTQIPIPEQLADLTYMLPGADVEGASAWTFLLQLAERISVLTEVKPVVQFDPNVVVDYSELTVVNEYFYLTNTEFDETTNTLTLTLKWRDQTEPIDPTMANPMCILSGIRLTPRSDAAWSAQNRLNLKVSGSISYDVYLRASGLYTFACKEENQKQFGLYPYVNPDEANDKGGHFSSTYKEFEDSYVLDKTVKNGWLEEGGNSYYYENGVMYTGIRRVDGVFYDFGDDGICVSSAPYNGFIYDDIGIRYAINGMCTVGWLTLVDGEKETVYYFGKRIGGDYYAMSGQVKLGAPLINYTFNDNYELVAGDWYRTSDGNLRYYWAGHYVKRMYEIDGKTYCFDKNTGYLMYGIQGVRFTLGQDYEYYWFDEETGEMRMKFTGSGVVVCEKDGAVAHVVCLLNGVPQAAGLVKNADGSYYFFGPSREAARGPVNITLSNSNGLLPAGTYVFSETDCRLVLEPTTPDPSEPSTEPTEPTTPTVKQGLVKDEDGKLRYYVNGEATYAGLVYADGYYYYINSTKTAVVGRSYRIGASKTNGLLEPGLYNFGNDGRMIDPPSTTPEPSEPSTEKPTEKPTEPSAPTTPAVKQGLVKDEDGKLRYYVNGEATYAGLVYANGYYYYINSTKTAVAGRSYRIGESKTNGLLEPGLYHFGEDGRMIDPPAAPEPSEPSTEPSTETPTEKPTEPTTPAVKEGLVKDADGKLRYYVNGEATYAGLIYVDGYYYYINSTKTAVTGGAYRFSQAKSNNLLPYGVLYHFDENGRMIDPPAGK